MTDTVGSPSVLLHPTASANVTSPNSNLRVYSVDLKCKGNGCNGCNGGTCNALEFVSGTQVDGGRCWNGAFSPDGSLFAYMCQPGSPIDATIPNVVPNAFFPVVHVPVPGVVTLCEVNRRRKFTMQNWLTTAITPIAVTFSPDGTKLVVSGSDSPNVGGTNLYAVVEN